MFGNLPHRNWFPLILAILSLLLVLFVVWALAIKSTDLFVAVNDGSAVTIGQYQTAVRSVMDDFQNRYEVTSDWEARLVLVDETEQNLLVLRVPAEGMTVHFELVSAMELLKQGLVGKVEKLEEGQERLADVFSDNSWLTEESYGHD